MASASGWRLECCILYFEVWPSIILQKNSTYFEPQSPTFSKLIVIRLALNIARALSEAKIIRRYLEIATYARIDFEHEVTTTSAWCPDFNFVRIVALCAGFTKLHQFICRHDHRWFHLHPTNFSEHNVGRRCLRWDSSWNHHYQSELGHLQSFHAGRNGLTVPGTVLLENAR